MGAVAPGPGPPGTWGTLLCGAGHVLPVVLHPLPGLHSHGTPASAWLTTVQSRVSQWETDRSTSAMSKDHRDYEKTDTHQK